MDLTAEPVGGPPAPAYDDPLGVAERRMLESGKRQHAETTDSARRALQVAEQTADIARSTLIEVHRQGQQLSKTDEKMQAMEKDVHEASRILRFMRRWCCFQVLCCCDCCDPDADMQRSRQRRVKAQEENLEMRAANIDAELQAKQNAVYGLCRMGDAAFNGNEEAARAELMLTAAERTKLKQVAERPSALGYGLPEKERIALQRETACQDKVLDQIGTSVETLRYMSLELGAELTSQMPLVDDLVERTHTAHDNLGTLSKSARRI